MTRINVGILPHELSSKHLIAEHREIKRIPNLIAKGRYNIKNIPTSFTLGKGHVAFFYNKLKYIEERYKLLYKECTSRGYNVTDYSSAFNNLPKELYNNYKETPHDREIIIERLLQKDLDFYSQLKN